MQIPIDDPKAYTGPWTVEMPQQITLDTELIDEMCLGTKLPAEDAREVTPG